MENHKEGMLVARAFQRIEGISGETSKNNLRELAMLAWKIFFFIIWERFTAQCQMLIFSITQIIFPVLKKNLFNVNLLQYPFYYPIKINFVLCFEDEKPPHQC